MDVEVTIGLGDGQEGAIWTEFARENVLGHIIDSVLSRNIAFDLSMRQMMMRGFHRILIYSILEKI